jgi:outer membrane receptor for ferrienterochelin and colicin
MKTKYVIPIVSLMTLFGWANNPVQYGSLDGIVLDANTRQPLAGANIEIGDTALGASCNEHGYFLIKQIPIGLYRIHVSMMGYQRRIKTEVIIVTNRTTKVNLMLHPAILESNDPVEVVADYFYQSTEKPVSMKALTPQEIRFSAGSAEDIFRVIQAMPGVTSTGALSANLIVRGGSPDENRTLLDHIEIYSPLHFARPGTSMGIISIINPALISNVEFLSGGFPAEYGDKLSSVFEINLKESNRNRFNSEATVNLGGVGGYLEGPLSEKTDFIFSARRGYFDILTNMMNSPVSPQYWDFVSKITLKPNPSHQLSLIGFYYQDDFEKTGLSNNVHNPIGENYYHIKGQVKGSAAGLNWTCLLNSHAYMLTTLSFNNNSWQSKRGSQQDPFQDGDEICENELHLKSRFIWQVLPGVEFKGGVYGKQIDSNHHLWYNTDTSQTGIMKPGATINFNPDNTYKTGAFMQSTFRPIKPLRITAGIRGDYFKFTDEYNVSPRLALHCIFSDKISFNGAYGQYYQTPDAYQVALHPANQKLHSSRAMHLIAGVAYLPLPDTKITLECYQKDLEALPVENDYNRIITNDGSGFARGLEFFLQKKMRTNFVGSLAYTYAVSRRRQGAAEPEYDFEFDQRHNLTLISGYQFTNQWRLGVKFQYATGMPYTPVTGTVNRSGNWYLVEGVPYSARYPAIQKLDLRIDRFFHFKRWTMSVYLDLWNALNRNNVLFYAYSCNNQGELTEKANYDFPMMPIVGLSAQF